MKKYILWLGIFICITQLCIGQVVFIFNPDTLKAYAGKWQWINKRDTFTLVIKMDTLSATTSFAPKDAAGNKMGLYAWHKYVEKGKVIENNLMYKGKLEKSSGVGTVYLTNSTIYLGMGFTDSTRDRPLRIFFKIINKEGTKAVWESWPRERVMYPPPKPKIWEGRTIPSPIILNKISG